MGESYWVLFPKYADDKGKWMVEIFIAIQMPWRSAGVTWFCACACVWVATGLCCNPPVPGRNWLGPFWDSGWVGMCGFGCSPKYSVIFTGTGVLGQNMWPYGTDGTCLQTAMSKRRTGPCLGAVRVVSQQIWHYSMPLAEGNQFMSNQ